MKMTSKKAFTMIELIFVIVVIGILAAIAVPKMAATRDDAVITKAIATVGAMRSAISTERQKRILRGEFDDINGTTAEGLLTYGLGSKWVRNGDNFTFTGPSGNTCIFKIDDNRFVKDTCGVSGMDEL